MAGTVLGQNMASVRPSPQSRQTTRSVQDAEGVSLPELHYSSHFLQEASGHGRAIQPWHVSVLRCSEQDAIAAMHFKTPVEMLDIIPQRTARRAAALTVAASSCRAQRDRSPHSCPHYSVGVSLCDQVLLLLMVTGGEALEEYAVERAGALPWGDLGPSRNLVMHFGRE